MGKVVIDTRGYRCPRPILMIMACIQKNEVTGGDVLEVVADCPSFPNEVRHWCEMYKKVLVFLREEGRGIKRCQIQI